MTNQHASDCAVHSEPAYPAGPCDCHLSIESRLDEMIKHAYQGSTDAANEIRQELVERYKAMQPADESVREHSMTDVRCKCCGYMTYHREHMGCIRAAYQHPSDEPGRGWVGLTDDDYQELLEVRE